MRSICVLAEGMQHAGGRSSATVTSHAHHGTDFNDSASSEDEDDAGDVSGQDEDDDEGGDGGDDADSTVNSDCSEASIDSCGIYHSMIELSVCVFSIAGDCTLFSKCDELAPH